MALRGSTFLGIGQLGDVYRSGAALEQDAQWDLERVPESEAYRPQIDYTPMYAPVGSGSAYTPTPTVAPGFDWGAFATGAASAVAPLVSAFAPQPVQQGLQRGAAALPEEYRAYFQQFLPAASQPRAVMVRPEATLSSILPWLAIGAIGLMVVGKVIMR